MRLEIRPRPTAAARRRWLAALPAAVLLACGAHAEPVKLRVADSFPTGHFVARYATKAWMDEVTRRSNGEVTFEYYPAEQLGKAKDMLSLVQTGVADVSYIAPAYISDKLPLSSVAELPFDFASACVGTKAFWTLAQPGGLLARREFSPLGVRIMFALMLPPNQIVLAKAKFEGIKSLEGQKIRTAGAAKELLLRKLKAVPIQTAAPELHEAVARGTIDGMLIPLSSLPPYELDKVTKVATATENFGSFIITYGMSEARWARLSPQAQKVLTEVGEETTRKACASVEADDAKVMEKIKASGMTLVSLSAADKQTVNAVAATVADDWADALEHRGKPGKEILKAFKEALK